MTTTTDDEKSFNDGVASGFHYYRERANHPDGIPSDTDVEDYARRILALKFYPLIPKDWMRGFLAGWATGRDNARKAQAKIAAKRAGESATPYVRMKPDGLEHTETELEQQLQAMFPDLFPGLKKLSPTNWRFPVPWERRWELSDGQKLQALVDEGYLADAQYLGED